MAKRRKTMPRVFDERDLFYLRQVIEDGLPCAGYGAGKMTQRFEEAFAAKVGTRFAYACNSAMSGLHLAVAVAGAGAGDEVIVDPTVSFAGLAVMYNNATPVFADVLSDTYLMDPQSLQERITERTKAVIVTHLWGLCAEMEEIMAIAERHNLVVIEDCAHALLAQYKGRYAGTLGHLGVFSFQRSKHLGLGDGGMITTDREDFYQALREFEFTTMPDKLAWNYRISELVSAVGMAQLERIDEYVEETCAAAEKLNEAVKECPWLVPQAVPPYCRHVYHLWVPLFRGEEQGLNYEEFQRAAKEIGLPCSFGYIEDEPAYLHPVFREPAAYGRGCPTACPHRPSVTPYERGLCPVAEEILPRMVLFYTTVAAKERVEATVEKLRRLRERWGKKFHFTP